MKFPKGLALVFMLNEMTTWGCQLGDIGDNDECPGEVALVASLGGLHGLSPQDDLHAAGDGAARQLRLCLLDTHLDSTTESDQDVYPNQVCIVL